MTHITTPSTMKSLMSLIVHSRPHAPITTTTSSSSHLNMRSAQREVGPVVAPSFPITHCMPFDTSPSTGPGEQSLSAFALLVVAKWWCKRIGCHATTTDEPGPCNKRSLRASTCKQDSMMTATFEISHPNQSECAAPKMLHAEPTTNSCQSPQAKVSAVQLQHSAA